MTENTRQPLELSEIDARFHRPLGAEAPAKMKMMAARGMLPAPPDQLIRVLYQLQFEPEPKIQQAAATSLKEMPAAVLNPPLAQLSHPGLLDWIGELRRGDDEIGAALVQNKATPDQTVVRLCEGAGRELADIIATNQMRILRSPAIIEGLYKNPAVSSATIDSLIELAQRNQVELKGLPGLNAAIKSGERLVSSGEGVEDADFSALLQQEAQLAEQEEAKLAKFEELSKTLTRSELEKLRAGDPTLSTDSDDAEAEEDEEDPRARGNLVSKIGAMNVAQKIRLATVGSREAITVLVRDQNRSVHLAAIRSPRVKPADIAKFASNKSLPDGVIEYIAGNRDWTQKYEVMKNLVYNPKTPLRESLKFLNHLRSKDLRDLSRSRNVSHQVSRAALGLSQKRSGR